MIKKSLKLLRFEKKSKNLIKKMKRSFLYQSTSKGQGKRGRKGYTTTTTKGATAGSSSSMVIPCLGSGIMVSIILNLAKRGK
jgi:hypothetical protein